MYFGNSLFGRQQNQMKRILYFLDYPFAIGGANKVLITQAYIMMQKGYKVLVVIPNDQNEFHIPEYDQLCKQYGLTVMTAKFPVYTCMESIHIMEVMEAYDEVRRIVSAFMPDLIHSIQLNITVEFAARELEVPHLMNIYQTDNQQFMIDWLKIYPQYHSADSDLLSKRWGEGLGIMTKCIRVAYESKGMVKKCSRKRTDSINVITIGVLCERKNQMEIIKFVMRCRAHNQKVMLNILGEDNNLYGTICKQFVKENGLQDSIFFAGFHLNIEDYLQDADLLILASTVESYPGVLVESMANQVPVISTPVAGVPEILKDYENGFLTMGFEADDIYRAFLKYMECRDRGGLTQITDQAYSTYLKNHTYLQVGNQLEEYYEMIMNDYVRNERSFLKITDIRQLFDNYIRSKKVNLEDLTTRDSLWFLYHVFMQMEKKDNKKIVVWGAGMWGEIVIKWIRQFGADELEVMGFIDVNKKGMYLEYPIIQNRDTVLDKCGTVFVAVADIQARLEIMNYLDRHGKVRNSDYFMVCNGPVRM